MCALSQIPNTLEPTLISFLQIENLQLNTAGEVFVPVLSCPSLVSLVLIELIVCLDEPGAERMTTLLTTTIMLSLKGQVPVNNSDVTVIERNSVSQKLGNTTRESAQKLKNCRKEAKLVRKRPKINLEN